MSFFQNTCKPEGIGGKIMVNMMNAGHSSMAEWGFTHIEIRNDYRCLDIGCGGGANVKKLLVKTPYGKVIGIDEHLVVPNRSLSVYEGAIVCWRGEKMGEWKDELIHNADKFDFPIFTPYYELTDEQRRTLWEGTNTSTASTISSRCWKRINIRYSTG